MQVEGTTVSKIEAGKWNFTIDFLNLFIVNLELTLTIDKKYPYANYEPFLLENNSNELEEQMRDRPKRAHEEN
jgi:hypothetical protein